MKKPDTDFYRYYNREKNCPKNVNNHFWELEQIYALYYKDTDYEKDNIMEYSNYGLSDFNEFDGVPLSFKALLFNRFSHWQSPDIEEFKKWYKKCYLQQNEDEQ